MTLCSRQRHIVLILTYTCIEFRFPEEDNFDKHRDEIHRDNIMWDVLNDNSFRKEEVTECENSKVIEIGSSHILNFYYKQW